MSWATAVANLDSAVFSALSDSKTATYTPIVGSPVSNVSIIVEQGADAGPGGVEFRSNEILYTISARRSEVGSVSPADTFSDGVTTWEVVEVADDDGTMLTLDVKPQ